MIVLNHDATLIPAENAVAIHHMNQAIAGGEHWFIALLEAIRLWDTAEETYNGRTYRYLIGGEALDWLLLAERLCTAIDGMVTVDEKIALLFFGQLPLDLPPEEFKQLIGHVKHYQYLNYFYGITVEEALVLAVQKEVRKERWASGYHGERDTTNEAYRRIYTATKAALLRRFRREKKLPQLKSISLTELKEFTYWLFKYRLKHCDRAKMASDTRKALNWLNASGLNQTPNRLYSGPEYIDIALPVQDLSRASC